MMTRRFFYLLAMLALMSAVGYATGPDTLSIVPNKTSVAVGEEVIVTVFASSPNQSMNAVSGSITIPGALSVGSIATGGSVINFWTEEPHIVGNRINFEGIVLNPGYLGSKGKVFSMTLVAKKTGSAPIAFNDGAILANDGFGTNIIDTLGTTTIAVKSWISAPLAIEEENAIIAQDKPVILPVITDYSPSVTSDVPAYVRGKGQPNSVTKIVFENTAPKSIGERFIDVVRTKKHTLGDVLVKNNSDGTFEYTSNTNLIAGVYNATPFLVDETTNTERPGLGVQLLVKDSKIVHYLVIFINILGLLVPIVGLMVLIYFIPWYSLRRMRLLKRRLGLEEEKIEFTEHKLKHKESSLEKSQ